MKTVIKIMFGLGALVGAMAAAQPAGAEVQYFSTRSVLTAFFPKSERVSYRTVALEGPTLARITRRLGHPPPLSKYVVFVATTQGRIDGYAVIDDEKGLHEPITFATKLSPQGAVEEVEIMAYREPRGDEVRDPRFRRQFEGRTARDEMRIGQDIDAVSGATISSISLAVGVRRAAVLVEEVISSEKKAPPLAAASGPVAGTDR